MKDYLIKNKKNISTFLVIGLIFARCNMGLAFGNIYVGINLLFDFLAFVYCICLVIFNEDKRPVKNAILSPAIAWALIFSILVYVYGHYQIRYSSIHYSRMYAILTVAPAIFILILLYYNSKEIMDILCNAGTVVIMTTLVTSLIFDEGWGKWLQGDYARVGETPAGTCIDSGNLILLMLIPILYRLIVEKKVKRFLWITLIGIFQIVATGAKSSVLPIVFVFAIMIVGASDDIKVIRRNLIILAVCAVVSFVAIMVVPPLYEVVGYRIAELFTGVASTEYDLHTSTGQRMAMISLFKEHFGEYPLFGHGFYAFKEMAYSAIEEYKVDGVVSYRNVQIHMNFLELLFSYGIVGFVLYYWFPVYVLFRTIKARKFAKIMVFSIMISFLFMDLGIDMYYKYLFPYYAYFLAYFFMKQGQNNGFNVVKG